MSALANLRAKLRVTPVKPGFVARIDGVDISSIDDETFATIYDQFLETPILLLPGQPDDPRAFFDFTNRFGEVVEHVLREYHHPEVRGVSMITNLDANGEIDPKGVMRSLAWHTDRSYDPRSGKTTALLAEEIPSVGGHTVFADLYRAYADLPDDLRRALAGKTGMFHWHGRQLEGAIPLTSEQAKEVPGGRHPILQIHPESGRPTLYVDPGNLIGIVGMTQEESEPILQRLFKHCLREELHYGHRWSPGDLIIWDNRCSMHRAGGGYPAGERRILMRTQTIAR